MKQFILYSILVTLILTGCNNSAKQQAEQQAREKFVADSVASAIQIQQQQKQAILQAKTDMQKVVDSLDQLQNQLKQDWAQTDAELTAANDNSRSVSEFHLLRTTSDRQAEIKNASLKINELKLKIANMKQQYDEVQGNLAQAKTKLASMQ